MDEISEAQDQMQQMNDVLSQPIGAAADMDEDELAAELAVSCFIGLVLQITLTRPMLSLAPYFVHFTPQSPLHWLKVCMWCTGSSDLVACLVGGSTFDAALSMQQRASLSTCSISVVFTTAGAGSRGPRQPIAGACPSASHQSASQSTGTARSRCWSEDAQCACSQAKAEDSRGAGAGGFRSRDGCIGMIH